MKKISLYIIATLSALLFLNSCVDTDYAEPTIVEPSFTLPDGASIKTITELKKIYTDAMPGRSNPLDEDEFVEITEDIYISGYVVSNDAFGNFYKNLVIQGDLDGSSEGIVISIGESDLNSKFAVGQKIFVKCKGLVLGLYGNNVQLGGGSYWYKQKEYRLGSIISPSISEHFFLDGPIVEIPVKKVTIDELDETDRFTLITLENVQFKGNDAGTTWGNVGSDHSEIFPFKSTIIEDAAGNTLTVFTSNYSDFGFKLTPTGRGTITGVLSAHKGTPQLVVNSLDDVKMDDPRLGLDGDVTYDFNLDFQSQPTMADFSMENWINYSEKGSNKWFVQKDNYSVNIYTSCSNYNTGDAEMISWLVTPEIDASTQKYFALSTAQHHWAHGDSESPIEILYSEDFDGSNVGSATWKSLTVSPLAVKSTKAYSFVKSNVIDLPIANKIYIAIKYRGTNVKTTGYLVDDIRVFKKN